MKKRTKRKPDYRGLALGMTGIAIALVAIWINLWP